MPLYKDRVKDTTTTTGTGTITVTGTAPTGYQAFATAFTVGTLRIPYAIVLQSGSEWEVGWGTLATSTTLARTSVRASSNSGSLVNFSAGTKDVFCTIDGMFMSDLIPRGRVEMARLGAFAF
jgi:hypothetical protein